ncbi:MAG: glycosyltransferase family 39 protein [Steroidobacteraceae bacterium]
MSRRSLFWLALLALAIFTAGMGLRNPWPADEPLFAAMARDMVRSGQWLIPMMGGDYWQDKPPLFIWMIAVSDVLTGSLKLGFLLPSLLAGVGTLVLVYDLARRLWNREAGFWAAGLLLLTVQFALQSRRGQPDAMLMFFTTLALYALLRQLLLDGGWRWGIVAGVAAGLGALTKVVGFFAFFVMIPWVYALWRGWPGIRWQRPWYLWGVVALAFFAVVATWLVPMLLAAAADPAVAQYRDELLIEQTVGRYANPWHHYQPPWYYLQVIATSWMPLTLLLPWLVPGWVRALRERDARTLLPLGYAVIYVLFFTVSRGKRELYILSALPAVVLAAAPMLPGLLRRRAVLRALLGLAALLVAVLLAGFLYLQFVDPRAGAKVLAKGGVSNLLPLLAAGSGGLAAILIWRMPRAHLALAGTMASVWLVMGWWVFPQMDGERSASRFIARLEGMASADRPLGLVAYQEHFLWNLRRPSVNFGNRRTTREGDAETFDAAAWLARDPRRQLLVRETMMQPCFAGLESIREVGYASGEDWFLVSGSPDPSCVARGDMHNAIHYDPQHP